MVSVSLTQKSIIAHYDKSRTSKQENQPTKTSQKIFCINLTTAKLNKIRVSMENSWLIFPVFQSYRQALFLAGRLGTAFNFEVLQKYCHFIRSYVLSLRQLVTKVVRQIVRQIIHSTLGDNNQVMSHLQRRETLWEGKRVSKYFLTETSFPLDGLLSQRLKNHTV